MKKVISVVTNRLLIMMLFITFCFGILVQRLFELQIVNGEQYASSITSTISRTLEIPAIRGGIYDRYGLPLAINKTAFSVKFDPSIAVADLNTVIYDLLKTLEKNDERFIDELPITKDVPYEFTFSSSSAEKRWKQDMGMENEQLDYTAAETVEHLRKFFDIPPEFEEIDTRNMVSIRSAIFMQRYRQYNIITLARDINQHVLVEMEERSEKYPGMFVDSEALRYYPEGEYFAHILGYIRPINEEELKIYEQSGYTNSDLIGKLGIEKAYELALSGQKGQQQVEVTTTGKVASKKMISPPKGGDNIYLTLDSALQKKTANILLKNLEEVLIKKLDSGEITLKQLFISMVNSNNISIKSIMNSSNESTAGIVKNLILKNIPEFSMQTTEDIEKAKEIIMNALENNSVTLSQFILCLYEQGIITCNEETVIKLHNGTASPYAIVKEKIMDGEISPRATNLDPCTGSVAVVDINTGDVLALVTYPSYDNNMLVNNFNNDYYQQLLSDPTTPLINRPLMERKAPGSTLKMLSAIAGLESGIITPRTQIHDRGIFESAGTPFAKCLIYSRYGTTHVSVDVTKAIEVSCNYFFYEMAYRMGNAKEGTTANSIAVFNEYMKKFGLGDYTGVEIEEYKPMMATPEAKENADNGVWRDGDSIRSAIGQSYNSYTVTQIAKYIATLANGGTRYSLELINGLKGVDDKNIYEIPPKIEEQFYIAPENLKAVCDGMLAVTSGSQGTLRNLFSDFPIKVAGKTGTAEESDKRPSHTWFTGYAPFDDPQIAVVVMIPFGESTSNPAPKIAKEIFAEYLGLNAKPDHPVYENSLVR